MTIRPVTYYQAVCDRCGHVNDGGDYSAWSDIDEARMDAVEAGWTELSVRVPSTTPMAAPSYIVRPGGKGEGHLERSFLVCEDHTYVGSCARCDDDLDEYGWAIPTHSSALVQTCPSGHINTIKLKEQS